MAPVQIRKGRHSSSSKADDDRNFFEALVEHLELANVQIQVSDGRDRLREFLGALVLAPEFRTVGSVAIVRDADESADGAFQSIQDSLAHAGLTVPDRPAAAVGQDPSVSVLILPGGEATGMLETLLCRTFATAAVDRCIDAFFRCVEQSGTAIHRPDKARAHAWLATQPEPQVSVGVAAKKGYWNLDHDAFGDIHRFLRSL